MCAHCATNFKIQKYKKFDKPNVTVVGYDHNKGKGYAVRYGMARASGNVISFIDAGMDIDPNDINSGAFELDYNEIFVARLVKAGYMMKREDTDADIVDRWFQNVCRHVVMETWEQEQAIAKSFSGQFVREKDIGDGRKEVS